MNALPLVVSLLLCLAFQAQAQSTSTLMGSRASGMAYASATLSDEWALHNNIAGLAGVEHITAAFTYDALPAFTPFNKTAASVVVPATVGVVGLGVYRFGDDLYNEQVLSLGYANTFGLASLGVKVSYIQYNAEGFGRHDAVTISAGGIATLSPQLQVGAYITNINQPFIVEEENERMPTILALGVAFKPTDKLLLAIEIEKELIYPAMGKLGLEYWVHPKVACRTGFAIRPESAFMGFGFRQKNWRIDYAFNYPLAISARHQATIGYAFTGKSK